MLGLPYDASSSFLNGAARAPTVIRAALACESSNAWSEAGVNLGAPGVLGEAGDLALGTDAAATRAEIERGVGQVLASGARPISLGGDHSVTYPILRAVRARHARLTVLHLDAHADLYDEFEGDRFSHACPFARVMEERLCDRLVQVGVRTLTAHQRAQAKRFGVEIIEMRAWAEGVRPRLDGPVYLSLDLDGLDPACAPGVSHWEPGGLTTREVIGLIQNLPAPFVGADVVELNPVRDVNGFTATVAAKLVKEIASRMIETAI
ncbi:MAG: agmatinase [Opitutus sp.]|nr:agmatinase [Opitutus sp.]